MTWIVVAAATAVVLLGTCSVVVLIPAAGPWSLLLLPVTVVAFRGCPTCWVIGLIETISRGKLQRDCVDGQCKLTTAS
ncbi:hypothetical protein [Kribbella sp.]|uniref:hypothetical protein n=1 Tax=Kribbella sp. TaxID=1871183 RepID=UPI002D3E2613|nr:hypothetical protein [Kribbella sp.]HZX03133.1 hypothetical protein [Kribbella sp.]